MIDELKERLKSAVFTPEEAASLHKAIDSRTRPQPVNVTQTHGKFSLDGFATYLLDLEVTLDPRMFADEVKRLAKQVLIHSFPQPYRGQEGDGSPCIPKAESVNGATTWHVGVFLEGQGCPEHSKPTTVEFPTHGEAIGYLGKLTNEINSAAVGEIALVRVGDLSFRPKDVIAVEVHEA